MKWLMNNWWGRFYLVVQTACLVITIFLSVRYVADNREIEKEKIQGVLAKMKYIAGYGDQLPPVDERTPYIRAVETIQREHSKQRRKAVIYYLTLNLIVPIVTSCVTAPVYRLTTLIDAQAMLLDCIALRPPERGCLLKSRHRAMVFRS